MKILYPLTVIGVLFLVLLSSGCTSSSPQVPTPTIVPTTAVVTSIPTATPTAVPFPNALALNQYASFGSGERQGKGTVYRYEVRPTYTWTSPSWNSPREQVATSQPLELQPGYNIETPKPGNTFLFVYVRVANNGSKAVNAPAAQQFVVYTGGKTYSYSSVHSSDVVIDKVSGTQYDYQIGRGGEVGYVQPGESNAADGYLIYEVPAPVVPATTYVVSNLDYQNQAAWKLG